MIGHLVTFPCGFLDQVWYLIVSFPDLCHLPYFHIYKGVGVRLADLINFFLNILRKYNNFVSLRIFYRILKNGGGGGMGRGFKRAP